MRLASPPASCKVYTPADLADAVVRALSDGPRLRWLEPAHGKGAFLEAMRRLGVSKRRIVAIDLDRGPAPADHLAVTIRGIDFLRWAQETDQRFDRIVANPPFISIRELPRSLKDPAASTLDLDGRPIGCGANLWYAFVVASLRLLKDGGSLAFVLPAAAQFANYSASIRRAVRDRFERLELFQCKRPLFTNVQEGTLVAIGRGYGAQPCTVRRTTYRNREELVAGLSHSGSRNGHKCPAGEVPHAPSTVRLDSVAKIGLGGVTGDASYFLMTEERRQFLNLPLRALTPVLSKAKHLRSATVDQMQWNQLRQYGQRIWLFNPTSGIINHPAVRRYLHLERGQGGCNREAFKVLIREPWYQTPLPRTPHAFLSGMSQHGPWLCINEMPRLNATNTLYVVTFKTETRESWYMWALALLSSVALKQVRRLGRRYPDGLIKYEPGALSQVRLPLLKACADYRLTYTRAVTALLSDDLATAKAIADSLVA